MRYQEEVITEHALNAFHYGQAQFLIDPQKCVLLAISKRERRQSLPHWVAVV